MNNQDVENEIDPIPLVFHQSDPILHGEDVRTIND
jgi:hypothetical protein